MELILVDRLDVSSMVLVAADEEEGLAQEWDVMGSSVGRRTNS